MIYQSLAIIILGLFLFWMILRWNYNRKLNKLRRKYELGKEEDLSKGKSSIGIESNTPRSSEARFQVGTGNPETERTLEQIRTGGIDSKPAVIQPGSMDRSPETERWIKSNNGFSGRKFRRI